MNLIIKIILLAFYFLYSLCMASSFLTVSDIHYGDSNLSQDGEDTGPAFLEIAMEKFKKLSKHVDFILYLGDLPTHSLFNYPSKGKFEQKVFEELYRNNIGSKPMFYISGNNDSLLGDYHPFEGNGVSPLNFAINWNGACAYCNELLIDDSHMYHDGYYSSYLIPGNKKIILIVLNATQWAITPIFSYPNQDQDALTQLSWFKQQLKENAGQQLLIAMHEPPGNSAYIIPMWHTEYLNKFIEILNENSLLYEEITLLTSHTHMEEFRKIHLQNGNNIYAYATPGISRIHHNYPGMNIFSLDSKLKIKNFTTYYTSDLNSWKNEQYQALNAPDSIFPQCKNETLSQCLNQLTTEQVCDYLDKGSFYGVKSPTVQNNVCDRIYEVFPKGKDPSIPVYKINF